MSVVVKLHQRTIGGGLVERIIPAVVSQVMETARVSAQDGEGGGVRARLKELEREKNDRFLPIQANRSLSRNIHEELEGDFVVSSDAVFPASRCTFVRGLPITPANVQAGS